MALAIRRDFMRTFVRFIFLLLIVGVAMNLTIVMLSNARTHQTQVKDLALERERFATLIKVVSKQMRRGEMAVEWQRVDANQKVIETSLLLRQFMPTEKGGLDALPTVRVIIPGDRVCIDGLKLEFDSLFAEEYQELRDATLFYFARVYADGEQAKVNPDGTTTDKRFTFIPQFEVPSATRVHSVDRNPRPTYSEGKLWGMVWELIENKHPEKRGLTRTWMPPGCKVVKGGALYRITVGLEGVTIGDDEEGFNREHRDAMLHEAEKLNPESTGP